MGAMQLVTILLRLLLQSRAARNFLRPVLGGG